MLTVAKAIAMGALHRRESRGAHIREDHPKRNDERYLKTFFDQIRCRRSIRIN